jgi:hypothetical protein
MLNANAIVTVEELKHFLEVSDADLQKAFLSIYNAAAGATAATVQVTDTQIILTITGGASAGTSTLTFADADKDTLAELITAINALNKGWVVNIQGVSGMASGDLTVIEAQSCLLAANVVTLNGMDNLKLERYINDISSFLERETGRIFHAADYTEYLDGNDERFIWLDQFPVNTLTSLQIVEIDGTVVQTLVNGVDFVAYLTTGKLDSLGRWTRGARNIKIVYNAGYAALTFPQDLKALALNMIEHAISKKGKQGISQLSIGKYSVTYTEGSIPAELKAQLDRFKRVIF